MKRAVAREEETRFRDRFASTLVIAAAIIAAVRLARDENISRSSPRVFIVVSDSIALARTILHLDRRAEEDRVYAEQKEKTLADYKAQLGKPFEHDGGSATCLRGRRR